ncbi:hypothetical protein AV656_08070 [Bhargavaea cecembensis]|uniref:Uncharacterized protein n=1 Tax=Bhargavaea cecembensis TaxID=394098 RepID=A0A165H5N5_9BACL|nr:hypothetical protein [Bhargavaea cecembensis]KZE38848.1 hypothetical protein AV656_08070 [Bhargavaea cecembensis]
MSPARSKLIDYEKLPDIISTAELNKLFKEVLELYQQKVYKSHEFLEILFELASRQALTYEILAPEIKSEIDKELCELWNTETYDEVDANLSIVLMLGLENCFEKIKKSLDEDQMSPEIRLEIEQAIKEAGDNISDPYWGMKE